MIIVVLVTRELGDVTLQLDDNTTNRSDLTPELSEPTPKRGDTMLQFPKYFDDYRIQLITYPRTWRPHHKQLDDHNPKS